MREDNIEIFKDTERLCKTNAALASAIKESSAAQKLFLEGASIDSAAGTVASPESGAAQSDASPKNAAAKKSFDQDAKIVVSKKRTFEAAYGYKDSGLSVAVLNFASASNPGGGVVHGSSAQEECLCRCSTLYFNLNENSNWENFYEPHRRDGNPLHNDDIIYTPGVVVFKSDTAYPKLLAERDWQKLNVITCAAPNLRERPSNRYNSGDGFEAVNISDADLQALHEKRARRILDVAAFGKNDALILGAFGCGAFRNKPQVVAAAYKNVLADYRRAFKVIEFAVYCSPRDEENYLVFRRALG